MLTMLFVFFDLRRLGDSGCAAVIASSDFLSFQQLRLANAVKFHSNGLLNLGLFISSQECVIGSLDSVPSLSK